MAFKITSSKFESKKWTKDQQDMIKTINSRLKDCFLPKDNRKFLLNEIEGYELLLNEIEKLPFHIIKIDGVNIIYVKINDIENYETRYPTKRYFLIRQMYNFGGKVIHDAGKNKKYHMVKLNNIRSFIHTRLKELSKENENLISRFGKDFLPESLTYEPVIIKRIRCSIWSKKKMEKKNPEKNPEIKERAKRHSKCVVSVDFQKEIEALISTGMEWLHFKHDLFKSLNMVERTIYRWKQDGKYSLKAGHINLVEFYDFIKSYPQKFEIKR